MTTRQTLSKLFRAGNRRQLDAIAGAFLLVAVPLAGCGGGGGGGDLLGAGTGGGAGTDNPSAGFPIGRMVMVQANGSGVPHVVSSYYDPNLKKTWKMTVVSGEVWLKPDGSFTVSRRGGEQTAPVTVSGSGTYTVDPDKQGATLNYTSGRGPARLKRETFRRASYSYVLPGDPPLIPTDVPVTEVYEIQ